MAFVKGQVANPLGRPKGAVNKLTRTVREAFEEAFEELQKDPAAPHALGPWAKKNPDKFYLLAQKLIPTQVQAQVDVSVGSMTDDEIREELAALAAAGVVPLTAAPPEPDLDLGEDLV